MRETLKNSAANRIAAWDHPRVCGKHPKVLASSRNVLGSPPRMRETQLPTATASARRRITPAYAGNTFEPVCFFKLTRDHPRVCGKHNISISHFLFLIGSPPRMRETLIFNTSASIQLRITPAYAGNT